MRWGQLEDNKLRQLKETMPNATWMELSTHMMNSGFDKVSSKSGGKRSGEERGDEDNDGGERR